jgi:hypothetical protein
MWAVLPPFEIIAIILSSFLQKNKPNAWLKAFGYVKRII